jgi:hypothetical protein
MSKQEKIVKLTEAVTSNRERKAVEEWTAEDEGKLQRLKCAEVELADTALGRKKKLMELQFTAAGVDMPKEQFDRIIELRKRKHEEDNAD